ncbi:MAG: hypothetical protein DRG11_06900 [Epsilonproteobacteria bacterium]|nr:MAG: hypothetical protein B1H07_04365 [Campylobacteraceae bacterium 4484_166]RLA73850.1 MAG: hypothetical protein DRG11_06900 [Campylobacterota bacterium]
MKNILLILSGDVATTLLDKILASNKSDNIYKIVACIDIYDSYKKVIKALDYIDIKTFDATSYSKLSNLMNLNNFFKIIISVDKQKESKEIIKNIQQINLKIPIIYLDIWHSVIKDDENIEYIRALNIVANSLLQKLPNIPKLAQNIGLGSGEIMEITIPFGSKFAYRYIGSIAQNRWKLFGLYRDEKLMLPKLSTIIKPNDTVVLIGEPEVLRQIANIIQRDQGQFPIPYGKNIYTYLDMSKTDMQECLDITNKSITLNRVLKEAKLYIKINNPTSFEDIDKIKASFDKNDIYNMDISYKSNNGIQTIQTDIENLEVGLFVATKEFYQNGQHLNMILSKNIPIFISSNQKLNDISHCVVIPNGEKTYEQIASMIFDISSQFKKMLNIYDMSPVGDSKDKKLLDYLRELSITYNQDIKILTNEENPIRYLQNEKNVLQIMPMRTDVFRKRLLNMFSMDTDVLSFNLDKHSKILLPIIEKDG